MKCHQIIFRKKSFDYLALVLYLTCICGNEVDTSKNCPRQTFTAKGIDMTWLNSESSESLISITSQSTLKIFGLAESSETDTFYGVHLWRITYNVNYNTLVSVNHLKNNKCSLYKSLHYTELCDLGLFPTRVNAITKEHCFLYIFYFKGGFFSF